jgi:hypothetical protein
MPSWIAAVASLSVVSLLRMLSSSDDRETRISVDTGADDSG